MARADLAVLRVTGSGAITCMQGMLTSDVLGDGPNGFQYGAALTPKGMIVTDLWLARRGDAVQLFLPTDGKGSLLEIFQRSLPPRLAQTQDETQATTVFRLVGPESSQLAHDAGLEIPEPGQAVATEHDGSSCDTARPGFEQPYDLQISCPSDRADQVAAALEQVGVVHADWAVLEVARILAGWPGLGTEIGPQTLPQEVRFDEIGGVSYTKGCYTGQETVARVHFRGHANRWLAGLVWDAEPSSERDDVTLLDKAVGRVSSIAWILDPTRVIGLAVIRREVEDGDAVTASGAPARVSSLPFVLD